jgi:hypothetical protein
MLNNEREEVVRMREQQLIIEGVSVGRRRKPEQLRSRDGAIWRGRVKQQCELLLKGTQLWQPHGKRLMEMISMYYQFNA